MSWHRQGSWKMKFQIAIFDHGQPGPHKDYWVVRHPELKPAVLNSAYYDVIRAYPRDGVYDGAFKLESGIACLFRLFGGKRDQIGRSGHFVVVCAFFNSAEAVGKELSEAFRNTVFDDIQSAYEKDGPDSTCFQTQSIELQLPAVNADVQNDQRVSERDGKRLFTGGNVVCQSLMFAQKLPQSVGWIVDYSKKDAAAVRWKNCVGGKEPDSKTRTSTGRTQSSGKLLRLLTRWNLRIKSWHLIGLLVCVSLLGFALKYDSPWPRRVIDKVFTSSSKPPPEEKTEINDSSLRHSDGDKKAKTPDLRVFLTQNKNALVASFLIGFLFRETLMIFWWLLRLIKRLFLWFSRAKT